MNDVEPAALRAQLIRRFRNPGDPLDEDAFHALAHQVFTRNFQAVPPYAAYCRARDRTPDTVSHWTEIPAVPTAAFRELRLSARDTESQRVFRTSGTTRGPERRGEHPVAELDVYRASLRSTFRMFLLPDGARLPFLSLMPPADALPDSSLAFMISDVMDTFGDASSAAFADASSIDLDGLGHAVDRAVRAGRPVLLLGTSAAFIHWLHHLEQEDRSFPLAPGSRLMDTGGFKGRGRDLAPATLRALYQDRLGLPAHACVNEYGMTELLSQWYDVVLRAHHGGPGAPPPAAGEPVRRKQGPPWLRSVAVDPETLEPLAPGERGILRHLDLANVDSVAAVQTEDVGSVDDGGIILEGRVPAAPPRGCSLAMDLLLEGSR